MPHRRQSRCLRAGRIQGTRIHRLQHQCEPLIAHSICDAWLPQPSAAGAVAVIEFVVSMMMAML